MVNGIRWIVSLFPHKEQTSEDIYVEVVKQMDADNARLRQLETTRNTSAAHLGTTPLSAAQNRP